MESPLPNAPKADLGSQDQAFRNQTRNLADNRIDSIYNEINDKIIEETILLPQKEHLKVIDCSPVHNGPNPTEMSLEV